MAVFKCKMCGANLEVGTESVAVCEYCGTRQTLPRLDDEQKAKLYHRANHYRRHNEFDKAMNLYEQILIVDNTDAEVYWSLVLCRYGIEYVEDPVTFRRVPTVNRAQFTSIFDDGNYQSALRYADEQQRAVFEAEAAVINQIQKEILDISRKEEPFDVFICYKETDKNDRRTPDSVLATELYYLLTNEGYKVFCARITLENKLGTAYEPYIFAALNSAKVMVVLGTKSENFEAVWVKNEWSRYLTLIKNGAPKVLIPAYRDMSPYHLPKEFSHLQAQDMSKLGFMQDLIHGIKKMVKPTGNAKGPIPEDRPYVNPNIVPFLKRVFIFLEDGEWELAETYCEKVLDMDPENGRAYLGKLMVQLQVHKEEQLKDQRRPFDDSIHYKKVIRFGDEELVGKMESCIHYINARNERERRDQELREAMERRNELIQNSIVAATFLAAVLGFVCMIAANF